MHILFICFVICFSIVPMLSYPIIIICEFLILLFLFLILSSLFLFIYIFIYLFIYLFNFHLCSRLRDFLDPTKIFEDRKLNQILKDLTEALEFANTTSIPSGTTSIPSTLAPSFVLPNSSSTSFVDNLRNIQSLNLDLIVASGEKNFLYYDFFIINTVILIFFYYFPSYRHCFFFLFLLSSLLLSLLL